MTVDNYTQADLELLTKYAQALMKPYECAILLDVPVNDQEQFLQVLANHKHHELHLAYIKGVLLTKAELHEKLVQLSKAGSPAAQPIVLKLIESLMP